MDPEEVAAREAMSKALEEHAGLITRALAQQSTQVGLTETVIWICDPNDRRSRGLARRIAGPEQFAAYDQNLRKAAEARGVRPLYVFALERAKAQLIAAEISPEVGDTLTVDPKPGWCWCVYHADGFIFYDQLEWVQFTGRGGDA